MITKRTPAKAPDWVDDLHDVLANPAPRPLPALSHGSKSPVDPSVRPVTANPKPEERPALCQEAIVSARAKGIEWLLPSGYLALTVNQIIQDANPTICQKFFANFLHEAGDPPDPVERMLLESFALAHS